MAIKIKHDVANKTFILTKSHLMIMASENDTSEKYSAPVRIKEKTKENLEIAKNVYVLVSKNPKATYDDLLTSFLIKFKEENSQLYAIIEKQTKTKQKLTVATDDAADRVPEVA